MSTVKVASHVQNSALGAQPGGRKLTAIQNPLLPGSGDHDCCDREEAYVALGMRMDSLLQAMLSYRALDPPLGAQRACGGAFGPNASHFLALTPLFSALRAPIAPTERIPILNWPHRHENCHPWSPKSPIYPTPTFCVPVSPQPARSSRTI